MVRYSSIPLMRPLFFDFNKDKRVEEIDNQFMFGSQIMVAPIVREHQLERKVYLPQGQRWINAYTKEVFEGGVEITVKAPLDQIPTFIVENNNIIQHYHISR